MIDPRILYPIGTKRYLAYSKYRPPLELTYRWSNDETLHGIIEYQGNAPEPFWRDSLDGIYAFKESSQTTDQTDRCGVWPFTWFSWLPWATKLNEECKPHDFVYSCPAYQAFHLRAEADAYLEHLIRIGADGDKSAYLAHPFRELAEEFGGPLWENEVTR